MFQFPQTILLAGFCCRSYFILAYRQTGDLNVGLMFGCCAIFQRESNGLQALIERNRFVFRKAVAAKQNVDSPISPHDVKSRPQAVFRHDFG